MNGSRSAMPVSARKHMTACKKLPANRESSCWPPTIMACCATPAISASILRARGFAPSVRSTTCSSSCRLPEWPDARTRAEVKVTLKDINVHTASMSQPNVTLVVPNYNHAHYLPESLGSIAAQTRPPDRVLIIDDCSSDDSIAVISRILAEHPSWQLIRHETNQGVVRGQNEALALAETDWIGYLGADDALHPAYLQKALAAAESSPEAGLICACCEI